MKIPKVINVALDWVGAHARVVLIVLPLAVAALAVAWLPALAAFAVGVGVGGVAVHGRMTKRVVRLRAEADDLLRENGALRHEKNVMARSAITSGSVLTQKLPSIPLEDDEE